MNKKYSVVDNMRTLARQIMKPYSLNVCKHLMHDEKGNYLGVLKFVTPDEAKRLASCVRDLHGVVKEVMPQIGKVSLQDYERLNRGMILAEQIEKNSHCTEA